MYLRSLARFVGVVLSCVGFLMTPGCGLAAAAAVGLIEDEINGGGGGGGDDTVLRIENAAGSSESVAVIRVVSVEVNPAETFFTREIEPGHALNLKNLLDPGAYWVSIEFDSGFRTVPRTALIVDEDTTTVAVSHLLTGPNALSGSWSGAYQDGAAALHTLSLAFNVTGALTVTTVDGVNALITGTTLETSEGVFQVSFSDASHGLLVCDGGRTHAGLMLSNGSFGVLQKGASPILPVYASGDAVGSWTGLHLESSATTLDVDDLRATHATSSGLGLWADQDEKAKDYASTTPLGVDSTAFGRFACNYQDDAAVSGAFVFFVSADKTYAFGAYDPTTSTVFPNDLTFFAATKAP